MFPLSLQSIISDQMRLQRLRGAWFNRLLRHPARRWSGSVLSPGTHTGCSLNIVLLLIKVLVLNLVLWKANVEFKSAGTCTKCLFSVFLSCTLCSCCLQYVVVDVFAELTRRQLVTLTAYMLRRTVCLVSLTLVRLNGPLTQTCVISSVNLDSHFRSISSSRSSSGLMTFDCGPGCR